MLNKYLSSLILKERRNERRREVEGKGPAREGASGKRGQGKVEGRKERKEKIGLVTSGWQ